MIASHPEPFSLILIEDDEGHARLIHKNLQRVGVLNSVERLKNGVEALAYFDRLQKQGDGHEKRVVVLDLNLPDIDGFALLRHLKGHAATRTIPVIVLTTTDDPGDIDRCYALGCNVFMTKPVGYEAFSEAIRKLGLMLTVVRVPHVKE